MASKDMRKNPCKPEGSEEREGKAVPGTVEVTVRVMGETGNGRSGVSERTAAFPLEPLM